MVRRVYFVIFFFQAEDGIRDRSPSRGLGDVYKRQLYDRDEYTIQASYIVFGSQEFYDEHVAENDRQYNIYFTLNDSANVSMNNIEPVIKQIAAACGIEEKNIIVNDLYLQWVLQPSCLLYTSPSPRDGLLSRMPSSA